LLPEGRESRQALLSRVVCLYASGIGAALAAFLPFLIFLPEEVTRSLPAAATLALGAAAVAATGLLFASTAWLAGWTSFKRGVLLAVFEAILVGPAAMLFLVMLSYLGLAVPESRSSYLYRGELALVLVPSAFAIVLALFDRRTTVLMRVGTASLAAIAFGSYLTLWRSFDAVARTIGASGESLTQDYKALPAAGLLWVCINLLDRRLANRGARRDQTRRLPGMPEQRSIGVPK
jgi:hypothetical protein